MKKNRVGKKAHVASAPDKYGILVMKNDKMRRIVRWTKESSVQRVADVLRKKGYSVVVDRNCIAID